MDTKLVGALSNLFNRILFFLGVQNDTDMVYDEEIDAATEFKFMDELGGPARYLKIDAALNSTLEYRMREKYGDKKGTLRTYPWGLSGGVPLNVVGENWEYMRITPPGAMRLRVYASTVLLTPKKEQTMR